MLGHEHSTKYCYIALIQSERETQKSPCIFSAGAFLFLPHCVDGAGQCDYAAGLDLYKDNSQLLTKHLPCSICCIFFLPNL